MMMLELADGLRVPVDCESGADYDHVRPSSLTTAIAGNRWGVRPPRTSVDGTLSWGVSRPSDYALLLRLAHGEFGDGPFRLVDSTAAVTNVLSAHVSTLGRFVGNSISGVSMSGAVKLDDGSVAGRSLVGVSDGVSMTLGSDHAAVAPAVGEWVTGSVYASPASGSTVQVGLIWYQPTNGFSYGPLVTRDASGSVLRRVSASGVVPASITPSGGVAGLVSRVGLRVVGASRVAAPAISWTSEMTEWGVGGSPRFVLIEPPSTSTIMALREARGLRASSVRVRYSEVGAP